MRFNVSVDTSGLDLTVEKIRKANEEGIFAMSEQALKDSNYFCKMDEGTLIDSSLIASDTEHGELVWDTPYAKRQYYLATAHKDRNPNAQMMWFHKAKDVHMNDHWIPAYKLGFDREMNR